MAITDKEVSAFKLILPTSPEVEPYHQMQFRVLLSVDPVELSPLNTLLAVKQLLIGSCETIIIVNTVVVRGG